LVGHPIDSRLSSFFFLKYNPQGYCFSTCGETLPVISSE
jgi:hypothetical protein